MGRVAGRVAGRLTGRCTMGRTFGGLWPARAFAILAAFRRAA
jgi:hypothetical protein